MGVSFFRKNNTITHYFKNSDVQTDPDCPLFPFIIKIDRCGIKRTVGARTPYLVKTLASSLVHEKLGYDISAYSHVLDGELLQCTTIDLLTSANDVHFCER